MMQLSVFFFSLFFAGSFRFLSSNSVGETYTDDGDPYGGRGGALYNEGPDSTVLFKRLAIFQDNVGSLVSGLKVKLCRACSLVSGLKSQAVLSLFIGERSRSQAVLSLLIGAHSVSILSRWESISFSHANYCCMTAREDNAAETILSFPLLFCARPAVVSSFDRRTANATRTIAASTTPTICSIAQEFVWGVSSAVDVCVW